VIPAYPEIGSIKNKLVSIVVLNLPVCREVARLCLEYMTI
jgi:hypothetical protein